MDSAAPLCHACTSTTVPPLCVTGRSLGFHQGDIRMPSGCGSCSTVIRGIICHVTSGFLKLLLFQTHQASVPERATLLRRELVRQTLSTCAGSCTAGSRGAHTSARGSAGAAACACSCPLKVPESAASSRRGVHTMMLVMVAPISSHAKLSHHIRRLSSGAARQDCTSGTSDS